MEKNVKCTEDSSVKDFSTMTRQEWQNELFRIKQMKRKAGVLF